MNATRLTRHSQASARATDLSEAYISLFDLKTLSHIRHSQATDEYCYKYSRALRRKSLNARQHETLSNSLNYRLEQCSLKRRKLLVFTIFAIDLLLPLFPFTLIKNQLNNSFLTEITLSISTNSVTNSDSIHT